MAIAGGVYFLFMIKFHGIGVIMKQQLWTQRISAWVLSRYMLQADMQTISLFFMNYFNAFPNIQLYLTMQTIYANVCQCLPIELAVKDLYLNKP